jgi:hypothetical protein
MRCRKRGKTMRKGIFDITSNHCIRHFFKFSTLRIFLIPILKRAMKGSPCGHSARAGGGDRTALQNYRKVFFFKTASKTYISEGVCILKQAETISTRL